MNITEEIVYCTQYLWTTCRGKSIATVQTAFGSICPDCRDWLRGKLDPIQIKKY